MDSFSPAPNQPTPVIRDTVVTGNATGNKNNAVNHKLLQQKEDSFRLSSQELSRIVQSIKANKITDINSIKDIVTFKDAKGFNVDHLSEHQVSKLVSAVRHNITENIAELIYNTKNNEKLLDITSKERAHIDNILVKLRQSHITDLNQALEFIKVHSKENPSLFSKISSRLVNVIKHNEHEEATTKFLRLTKDSYTPAVSVEANRFSNPFNSDMLTRSNQPKTAAEAKEFLDQVLTSRRGQNANSQATADLSNLILSNYLRGVRDPLFIAEEMTKGNLKQVSNVDEMLLKEKVLHKNVSYLNDIAAKVASEKARTIIIARLVGQVGGSASAALGMAAIVGTNPLIGIMGAFALTLVAAIVGFIIGRAAGEGAGKVITGTDMELMTPEEYQEIERQVKALEEERRQKQQEEASTGNEQPEEEDPEEDKDPETPTQSGNTSNFQTFEALKNAILFKKTK